MKIILHKCKSRTVQQNRINNWNKCYLVQGEDDTESALTEQEYQFIQN